MSRLSIILLVSTLLFLISGIYNLCNLTKTSTIKTLSIVNTIYSFIFLVIFLIITIIQTSSKLSERYNNLNQIILFFLLLVSKEYW